MEITVVIPCYNEDKSLEELFKQLEAVGNIINFIVLDNGSTDNTQEILKTLTIPGNIQVVKKKINTGYGAGIKYGLKRVKTEYSGWMHGDLQQNPKILLYVHKLLENFSAKEIKESKAIKGLRSGRPIFENLFTYGVAIVSSILFWKRFWDIAGQPNIFKTSSLKFLENAPDDHNFEFYVYINFLINNGTFKRFDAPFNKRMFGNSSWNTGFISKLKHSTSVLKYICQLRFKSET